MSNYDKKNIPFMSYGILCYKKNSSGNSEILIIRRKDTIGYMEFLRGKYDVDNDEYIIQLIDYMTIDEKKKILMIKDFDKLRNMLGMNKKNSIHRQEYNEAGMKFNKLLENGKLDELFKRSETNWIIPEWGIPKGRKHQKENNMECAIREFYEETLVNYDEIVVLYNVKPLEEVYKGINGVTYKHIYYFAEYIGDENKKIMIDETNNLQMTEISDVRWADCKTSVSLMRPYYIDKINIIKKAFQIINNKNVFFEEIFI